MGTEWEPYLLDLIPNYFDHVVDSGELLGENGDGYYKLRLKAGNTASFKGAHRLLPWNSRCHRRLISGPTQVCARAPPVGCPPLHPMCDCVATL